MKVKGKLLQKAWGPNGRRDKATEDECDYSMSCAHMKCHSETHHFIELIYTNSLFGFFFLM